MLRFHSAYWNHGGWPGYFFICWRIRDIALQSPELWSRFALGNAHAKHLQRWIDLHLEKSGHRLCTVYLDLGIGQLGRALGAARLDELTRRTQEFFIRNDDGPQNSIVHSLVGRAWPTLERMTLVTEDLDARDEAHDEYFDAVNTCLGFEMVLGAPDTLTSLHLDGSCATMHRLPRLPNLLDLSVKRCCLCFSYGHLRAGLQWVPRLVNLRVELVPEMDREEIIEAHGPPGPRLALPDLRHVWMSGLSGEVGLLLSILPHPLDSLSIDMQDDSHDPPQERLGLVMQVLECLGHYEQRSHPVLHTVAIDQTIRDDLPRIRLRPQSSDVADFGRIDLTFNQCDYTTLTLILGRVYAAEMLIAHPQFWTLIIETAGECTGPSIEELYIHHWKENRSTCIAALETYLRRRKERGYPLKTLTVGKGDSQHCLPVDQELASRWISQGWITRLIERKK